MWNLCECYGNEHKSTLIPNQTYGLCKGQKRKIDLSRYPKGTFFVISKVGEDPLKRHLKHKKDGKAQVVEKSSHSATGIRTSIPREFPSIEHIIAQEHLFASKMQEEGKIQQPYLLEELPEDY
jgi:hypothetical protein